MNSAILQIASRYIRSILLLVAVIALFRGHNHPGGGFIGGLLAGLSIVFDGLAYTTTYARKQLGIYPGGFVAAGFSLIFLSLIPGLVNGNPLMYGEWVSIPVFSYPELKLGSPLLFDTGIFFVVIGVTVLFFFSLKHSAQWK